MVKRKEYRTALKAVALLLLYKPRWGEPVDRFVQRIEEEIMARERRVRNEV